MIFVLGLVLVTLGVLGLWSWSKHQTRNSLLATALTDRQREIVAEQVPLTRKLPPELRAGLEGRINTFLHQVAFIGQGGLEVTDEMRLSIAAQASLLVVNSDAWYRQLRTILIYPGAFTSKRAEHSGYVVTERNSTRLGESWSRGPVVLSWAHTEKGALDATDGHNVVFHEFAHQVDSLSGNANGVPILSKGQSFEKWEQVWLAAYERHLRNVQAGRPTVFDPYGASGHEEFFAVAVEVFFERPQALKTEAPEVYRQLAELLRLDPSTWGASDWPTV